MPWWLAPASGGVQGCTVPRRAFQHRLGTASSTVHVPSSSAELERTLAASPKSVVLFTAEWCAPCVRFKPTFVTMPAAFPNVDFISVDIDAMDDAVLDRVSVTTVPTCVLMKRGKEVARIVGLAHRRPGRPLSAAVRSHLCE